MLAIPVRSRFVETVLPEKILSAIRSFLCPLLPTFDIAIGFAADETITQELSRSMGSMHCFDHDYWAGIFKEPLMFAFC